MLRTNNMNSYRKELKLKISELEEKILNDVGEKQKLELELARLKLAEFEEDLVESKNQQLLNG